MVVLNWRGGSVRGAAHPPIHTFGRPDSGASIRPSNNPPCTVPHPRTRPIDLRVDLRDALRVVLQQPDACCGPRPIQTCQHEQTIHPTKHHNTAVRTWCGLPRQLLDLPRNARDHLRGQILVRAHCGTGDAAGYYSDQDAGQGRPGCCVDRSLRSTDRLLPPRARNWVPCVCVWVCNRSIETSATLSCSSKHRELQGPIPS